MKEQLKYSFTIVVLVIIASIVSCKEHKMIEFAEANGIYFSVQPVTSSGFGNSEMYPIEDTVSLAFTTTKRDDSLFNIKVRVYGEVVDYDRHFNISIDSTSTAKKGEDYEAPVLRHTVPAGANTAFFTVKFLRSKRMLDEDLFFTLKLEPSSDFTVPFTRDIPPMDQQYDEVNLNTVTVLVNDRLYRPNTWDDWVAGDYTYAKMSLILKLNNLVISDFDSEDTMPMARFDAIILSLKYYLEAKKIQGDIVYETDYKGNIIYEKDENGDFTLDKYGNKIPVEMSVGDI